MRHSSRGPDPEPGALPRVLATGSVPSYVRTVVAASWLRSAAAGVDAEAGLAPLRSDPRQLADYRAEHRLALVFPLLYDVLGRAAEDCDCVMAVGDASGQLLWVCGSPGVLQRVEAINFVEGAGWDERDAGTNAPGTALRLDAAVQIRSAEHFTRAVQPWSCTAAPIHDPVDRAILGIVDITGGDDVASPQTLAMVRAAARMAEAELARIAAVEAGRRPRAASLVPSPRRRPTLLRVQALGRLEAEVQLRGRPLRLSRRHSELLTVLAERPEGVSGDELAVEVYPDDLPAVTSTVRAELVRLRALLGTEVLQSRPYRLTAEVQADWQGVAAHLAAGRLREAVAGYVGPLLPKSDSPGVVDRRDRLHAELRAAILASGQAELMVDWTRSRWGADDAVMWQREAAVLPVSSPLRALARAEADRLERELGGGDPR
ncbi:MAG: putative phytochrome sensor protein [Mycobacterium sp.]|nr:putative phytochrome sensor protein [Mycobacterium sp.]